MQQRGRTVLKLLAVPALAFLVLFFVVPVALLLRLSFSEFESGSIDTGFSIANYVTLVEDPLYRLVVVRTLLIAAVATVLCVLLGYPIALGIVRARPRWRPVLLVLNLTPLLIGGVIRCYGWLLLLDEHGLVNDFLLAVGVIKRPLALLFGFWSVSITMVEVLLPFFVLPVLGVLSTIDPAIERASLSLGASKAQTFFKVTLPLSLPGLIAGASIVFSLALTIFVVPRIIGGPSYLMLASLAYQQAGEVGNMPFGSAIAVLMLVLTLIVLLVVNRIAPQQSTGAARR